MWRWRPKTSASVSIPWWASPRLDVAASTQTVEIHTINPAVAVAAPVRFRMYANYQAFIDRAEVRLYNAGESTEAEPLAVLPVGEDGYAEWRPESQDFRGPVDELVYVLRAYDASDVFDETRPKPIWLAHSGLLPIDLYQQSNDPGQSGVDAADVDLLGSGYGGSALAVQNIPLGTGTVSVQGANLTPGKEVWVAGAPVPVDESGSFASEVLLPDGGHTVEVALLDEDGAGELYLRDLSLEQNDWFYAGMADFTWTETSNSGRRRSLRGRERD